MRVVLCFGGVAVVMVAVACSGKLATQGGDGGAPGDAVGAGSSGSVPGNSGASSSGIGSSSNSGGSVGSGASSSSSGGGTDDGGTDEASVDCGKIPVLHENPPGDIFCGFGVDGGALDCLGSAGDGWCCLGGSLGGGTYGAQICAQNAAGCTIPSEGMNPVPIQCNQISDCPANGFPGATACCLQGASFEPMPGCGYSKALGGESIVCEGSDGGAAAACQVGEIQICSITADCPPGMACMPGTWKIFELGFCM